MVWLSCLLIGEFAYLSLINFLSLKICKFFLIMICFGFSYHMLNGIRHIFWDFGIGVRDQSFRVMGYHNFIANFYGHNFFWSLQYYEFEFIFRKNFVDSSESVCSFKFSDYCIHFFSH